LPNLQLPSLRIQNFRGIPSLVLKDLGRANLFVGPNGAGKSSVLDAIRLFSEPGKLQVLIDLLAERHEIEPDSLNDDSQKLERIISGQLPLELLYPGGKPVPDHSEPILIGPAMSEGPSLTMQFTWQLVPKAHLDQENENGSVQASSQPNLLCQKGDPFWVFVRGLSDSRNSQLSVYSNPKHRDWAKSWIPTSFVGSGGLGLSRVDFLWSELLLTDLKLRVVQAVKLVDERIEEIGLRRIHEASNERLPFARIRGSSRIASLPSLGDGVSRAFGIALSTVSAKDGFLLIDEFENGLHYSTQLDLWRFVFDVSKRNNVQVFATTHSNDCVAAFQEAAAESPEEGRLYRIGRKDDRIVVATFDEEDLEAAVATDFEIRG
jgi:AAA domain, putative AbiEii toxin, Type IV TA system/AAA ATPase domain